MSWFFSYVRSSVGAKQVMAVTGLGLLLFAIAHMVGHFGMFGGRDAYNSYAHFLQSLGALGASEIRRHDRDRAPACLLRDEIRGERCRLEMIDAAAEGVFEGRQIVHVEGNDVVHAHRLEQLRHVP